LIGGSAVGFYRFSFLNLNKLAPLQYFSFRFSLNDKKFCSKQISSDRKLIEHTVYWQLRF